MVSADFKRQLAGYGLTTAQILYRRPDHNWLLQSYVWQDYDLFPQFPELQKFLEFWRVKLEGPLHSVMVAHSKLIAPADAEAKFAAQGITRGKTVIAYCGGGISATIDLFLLPQLGCDKLTLYDGSMGEWAKDASLPIETD